MLPKGHSRLRRKVFCALSAYYWLRLNPVSSDEYCPSCDNHFVLDAKTQTPTLNVEGKDIRIDARMLKDHRIRGEQERSNFKAAEAMDRLG